MRPSRCHLVTLALLTGALALPASARAQTTPPSVTPSAIDEAEQFAEEAFNAYAHQDFRRAIALYEMALAAAPSADILYNIARVYDLGLNDTPNAIAYYRKYIAHARARRPRSELAQQRIRELSGDGAAAPGTAGSARAASGAAPGGPGGSAAGSASRDVADGSASASASSSTAAVAASSTWTTSELTAAALTGAGAVALSVGVGFGVSAYAERDTWRSMCDGNECSSQGAVDAARSATRKANVATVALASGGGLLALAAGFWWLAPRSTPATEIGMRLSPGSSGADLGCTLSGTF